MKAEASRMSWRGHVRALSHSPALVVWCLFLILTPVYVVKSGLPQPGDALVLLLVPLALAGWDGKLDKQTSSMIRALLWFTVWVCVVNYAWSIVLGRWRNPKDFVIHPLFYIFNAATFLAALVIAKRNPERFVRITVEVVFGTIVVMFAASFVYRTELYRGTLFFNSPNQLGYYALLAACLFAMAQRPLGIGRFKASLGVTCCAYLAMLSASRASLAGIIVLLFVLLFENPRTIIIGSIVAIAVLTIGGPISNALDAAQQRATEDRAPEVSFAEERGYDRIWANPEYLVTGAGEGAYERFAKPGEKPRELHSSFGSVLFAYGIVGIALFLVFGFRVIRGAPLRLSAMLIPALVYTVAHQGLRFTTFWVVIAAFVVLKSLPDAHAKRTVATKAA